MLLAGSTGVPLLQPTLYALTELRARNRSSSTIQQALRAVMVLYLVLERLGIDLQTRLAARKVLEAGEIEEVGRCCRLPMDALLQPASPPSASVVPKVLSLEKLRIREKPVEVAEIDAATAAIRIYYIRGYLKWCIDNELLRMSRDRDGAHHELKEVGDIVLRALEMRAPAVRTRDLDELRQGLSEEALDRLHEVLQPEHAKRVWKDEHASERNALIIRWLLDLGLRRGELLGIRIEDINFQKYEVHIKRRADDPDDPRVDQPNAKTAGRLVPMSTELSALTHRYIMGSRRALPGSRRHSFLLVASDTGAPMGLGTLNKIFVVLRRKCPDLPSDLTTHIFRHTWNDKFSEIMDAKNVSEETEKKMRSRLMGWSETSGTAATYTRRHVNRKAREAALALQQQLHKNPSSEH
jgi:integrase